MTDGRATSELGAYQRIRQPAPPPTDADLRLADRLADPQSPRLQLRWLANGDIDITASEWVGVLRLSTLDIHITPKYVGGSRRLLKMLDFANDTKLARQLPNTRPLDATGEHLPELLCQLLAQSTHAVLRHGLRRSYRPESDDLPVLRGRLDHRAQLLRRFGQLDRLVCHFDEHDTDNTDNQLLCAALHAARPLATSDETRTDLARLHAVFLEACSPPTRESDWYRHRIVYSRLNERYRDAHDIAYLILDHLAFDDLFQTTGPVNVNAFLIDMNAVFERFVTKLLAAAAGPHLQIDSQHRLHARITDANTGRTYATLVPDLIVRCHEPARTTPVDIKYKLYSDHKLTTSDIYQAATYAHALATADVDARAAIIYPGNRTAVTTRLLVNGHHPRSRTHLAAGSLNVEAALEHINAMNRPSTELTEQVRKLAIELATGEASSASATTAGP